MKICDALTSNQKKKEENIPKPYYRAKEVELEWDPPENEL